MDIKEYVDLAKQAESRLENLNDGRAAMLLREVFKQIALEIEGTAEGVVRVPGLGAFNAKQVEREKDGQKIVVKRVLFRALPKRDVTIFR